MGSSARGESDEGLGDRVVKGIGVKLMKDLGWWFLRR
jgi:hypothetical protein